MGNDFWIWVHPDDEGMDEAGLGLIREARRLAGSLEGQGALTVVAMGAHDMSSLEELGVWGVDRVIYMRHPLLAGYHGERFARALLGLIKKESPGCILMAHGEEGVDLAARLGAMLETGVATRLVDAEMLPGGDLRVVRPRANDYLYETLRINCDNPPVLTFLPAVLTPAEPGPNAKADLEEAYLDVAEADLATRILEHREAAPEDQTIEDAAIMVAAGRGVGKTDSFDLVHTLARRLGASVGGTRPVIDWQLLPFDRQIGQTGKSVRPRLIINCGISGANEYTAGIEKSQQVIAINTDPRARIFRFADLGLVGDLHEILPLLIQRLGRSTGGSGN